MMEPIYLKNCSSHILNQQNIFLPQGLTTYAKIGVALELVRILIGNFDQIKRNPRNFHRIFLTKMNTDLIGFLVTYSTGYRVNKNATSVFFSSRIFLSKQPETLPRFGTSLEPILVLVFKI